MVLIALMPVAAAISEAPATGSPVARRLTSKGIAFGTIRALPTEAPTPSVVE